MFRRPAQIVCRLLFLGAPLCVGCLRAEPRHWDPVREPLDVNRAALAFRHVEGRWPRTFDELSSGAKDADVTLAPELRDELSVSPQADETITFTLHGLVWNLDADGNMTQLPG